MTSLSDTVRVLHVDDEPGFSELTAEFLERRDDRFVVETASDAAEARDRLAADIDCVVSDYDMPGLDGIEFLTAVREEYPDLPFILFTGQGSENVASDAISAGVTDYLQKGSGTDQYELLANRITNAVGQIRAERRLDEERRRFQALFENLSQAVVEVEWDGGTPIVKHVNPSFAEVFGYDADEVVGESLDEYVVPEGDADEIDRLNRQIRSESGLHSEEVTRLTADGPRKFLLQTATYGDGAGAFAVYIDITERRRHEREVERQNARLRALFENFPEPTIAYAYRDGDPHISDVNEAFARRFEVDAEAVTGERVDDLLVPPTERAEAERLNDRVRAGDLIDEEVRRRTPEGLGDFRIRNISVPGDDHIDGYCVYADITAYKRRERELERKNDMFEKAQAIADVGAWEYDIVADEFTWSEQMYEIHGYPTDAEVTVEEAIENYHPDDRSIIRDALTGAIERGESYDVRARIHTPAGECRWVRARGYPQSEDGARVRVRGTVQNITEHRDRELELQRERDRYQSLFENNPLIIWEEDFSEAVTYLEEITADVDDVESYLLEHPEEIDRLRERVEIIDVNQNAVEYYDAPSKQALIDNVEELFGDGATEAMAAEWAGIADGRTRFRNEVVSRTFSGEEHRELVDVFVPEGSADDYSRVYVIGTDITEQKERERELKRQNERLDAFASVVSHDLRSPLNVAEGRLELARQECDSAHLDAVGDAHDRMNALIADLLELARQGDPVGETEPVDLGAVPRRCWETVETSGAALRVEVDRSIHADPSRLRQLFENLYRNSVEHGSTSNRANPGDSAEHGSTGNRAKPGDSAEHGSTSNRANPGDSVERGTAGSRSGGRGDAGSNVTVTVGELDDGFYIEDDGPGIPEEKREDVFEAGYSTTDEGTGFGLSIVGEIVEAHGWTIAATEGTDGGARFEVTGVSFADG